MPASAGNAGEAIPANRSPSGTANFPPIATTPEIDGLLAAGAPVAVGVSGGKDSQAAALATMAHLDEVGHVGPRVLIHSDLGSVEWHASLPVCRRLADHLGVELIVVRRTSGDLMDRWESRWASSVRRYADLETVTLVLPWSTPSLRFCTLWLGDVAPQLLTTAQRSGLADAKKKAIRRVALERRITKGMLYVKGWPTRMLTDAEAAILAEVRRGISALVGIAAGYLDVASIHGRYAELIAANRQRRRPA